MNYIIILLFSFVCKRAMCSPEKCESHYFANPSHGRYCPTDGIVTPNLSWPQCKLLCLHSPSCQSINYNFTDNLCTYFTATCTKAVNHPDMAFLLFTGTLSEQCMEWISPHDSHPAGDRSVSQDNIRFIARMQKNRHDYVGYVLMAYIDCYSVGDNGQFTGYPCQYLRIRDGCTVYFVSYVLGTPLPPNALIGGYTALGLPVYIGIKEGSAFPGYYIPGSKRLAAGVGYETENVKILVSLKGKNMDCCY